MTTTTKTKPKAKRPATKKAKGKGKGKAKQIASVIINGATVLATVKGRSISKRVTVDIGTHHFTGCYLEELQARNSVRNALNCLGYTGTYSELKWRAQLCHATK